MKFTIVNPIKTALPSASPDQPATSPSVEELSSALYEINALGHDLGARAVHVYPSTILDRVVSFCEDYWSTSSRVYPLYDWLYHELRNDYSQAKAYSDTLFRNLRTLLGEPVSSPAFATIGGCIKVYLDDFATVIGSPDLQSPSPMWTSNVFGLNASQFGDTETVHTVSVHRRNCQMLIYVLVTGLAYLKGKFQERLDLATNIDEDPLGFDTIFDEEDES